MTAPGAEVAEAPELVELIPASVEDRTAEFEREVAKAREMAEAIPVTDEEEARKALEFAQGLKRQAKEIEEERISLTKPRKDAAEEIKRRYDAVKAPFAEAEGVVLGKLGKFQRKREDEARERQRVEEEERRRIEEEARAKREAAEKAEREAAELAAEAADQGDTEAAAELEAEARRDAERAAVTEQAIQSLPAERPAAAPSLDGLATPKRWEPVLTDLAKVPTYLPDGTPLIEVRTGPLRAYMYAHLKEHGCPPEVPGFEFRQVTGTQVRT